MKEIVVERTGVVLRLKVVVEESGVIMLGCGGSCRVVKRRWEDTGKGGGWRVLRG